MAQPVPSPAHALPDRMAVELAADRRPVTRERSPDEQDVQPRIGRQRGRRGGGVWAWRGVGGTWAAPGPRWGSGAARQRRPRGGGWVCPGRGGARGGAGGGRTAATRSRTGDGDRVIGTRRWRNPSDTR